jgi:DNA-binding MarR family transcriptional regulator
MHASARTSTVDAFLVASRALVAVAARSLADAPDDVTLPQYRALVLLSRSESTVSALAEALDVHPTTASRLVDRLVRKKLILRGRTADDRRKSIVSLSARGRRLVAQVTERRVEDIARIVDRMPAASRRAAVDALAAFAEAAGETGEVDLFGWNAAVE